ncbi:hypothetical protein SADUNF_Sadunf06G0018400 [Salix dunnii]|uniref:UBC core domain-containing protein n=1 Tax=Salix dunnii TaxID=1413687 RepID=A0A835K500_9ROSI|nr:hypothetical protein SADUNF_Sadunf06G0018400 [Salix dunnii]
MVLSPQTTNHPKNPARWNRSPCSFYKSSVSCIWTRKKIPLSLKFTNQSLISRRDRFLSVYYVSIKFTFLPLSREGEEDRATNENLPPNVIKQLAKELKNLDESPPEGIKLGLHMKMLLLSHDFPHSPPKGYFLTRIFHPNIASNGEICVNTLKKDWNPSLGLRHVLTVVRCLLIEPFPESALNEQAGKMLLENYEEYARHARIYTGIHAKPKPKFKSGAISESTTALNVDQSNTSVLNNSDQKNAAVSVTLQSALAPCMMASKGGNSQDQPAVVGPMHETEVSEPAAAPTTSTLKKDAGISKVQAVKKKMDARKKSLKRL